MSFLVINIKDEFRCIKRRPFSTLLPRAAAIFGKFPEISKPFDTYMNNNGLKVGNDEEYYERDEYICYKTYFHMVTHGKYNSFCFFVIYIGVSLLFSVD